MIASLFSPVERAFALAERYVRATERVAECCEAQTQAARKNAEVNAQTNQGWDRIVAAVERIADVHSDETTIDTTAITEAIDALRETLAIAIQRLSGLASEERNDG